jgi:maltose alpha-D-glucosyltransferase/alpha-amylase
VRTLARLEPSGFPSSGKDDWRQIFTGASRASLEERLLDYLPERRWFGGKARSLARASFVEIFGLPGSSAVLALLQASYRDRAGKELYVLPLAFASGSRALELEGAEPDAVVARLTPAASPRRGSGVVYDAVIDPSFAPALLRIISGRLRLRGRFGEVRGSTTGGSMRSGRDLDRVFCRTLGKDQSNTSLLVGDRFLLKVIRKVDDGISPELELGRFFARRRLSVRVPRLEGSLEYLREGREPATLSILQKYVVHETDAFSYTLDSLRDYFARVRSGRPVEHPGAGSLLELSAQKPSVETVEAMGGYLTSARLLGRRTAELHRALGAGSRDPSFSAEPITPADRRSLHRSFQALTVRIFRQLRGRVSDLPAAVAAEVASVLAREAEILRKFQAIGEEARLGRRIRCHGDYHLGQVLKTRDDFVIIDFEGEPARSLSERREKHSPLRDVAGLLRSLHYAVDAALGAEQARDRPRLGPAARSFRLWSSAAFLRSYLNAVRSSDLLPPSRTSLSLLLDLLILEKAIYEMGYELNHRPAWLGIPVRAVLDALDPKGRAPDMDGGGNDR